MLKYGRVVSSMPKKKLPQGCCFGYLLMLDGAYTCPQHILDLVLDLFPEIM